MIGPFWCPSAQLWIMFEKQDNQYCAFLSQDDQWKTTKAFDVWVIDYHQLIKGIYLYQGQVYRLALTPQKILVVEEFDEKTLSFRRLLNARNHSAFKRCDPETGHDDNILDKMEAILSNAKPIHTEEEDKPPIPKYNPCDKFEVFIRDEENTELQAALSLSMQVPSLQINIDSRALDESKSAQSLNIPIQSKKIALPENTNYYFKLTCYTALATISGMVVIAGILIASMGETSTLIAVGSTVAGLGVFGVAYSICKGRALQPDSVTPSISGPLP